jgi:hypothetical protein
MNLFIFTSVAVFSCGLETINRPKEKERKTTYINLKL